MCIHVLLYGAQLRILDFLLLIPDVQAIIARKLSASEIHDVMERIIQLSIVSDSESVKSQCRLVSECVCLYE